jgi:16S rRNA (uracil1498-N3)-methyltransferase
MRVIRTYVDAPLAPGTVVTLSESATAHLVRVLRLGLGEACVVFNGDGHDYDGHLVSLGKRGAEVEVRAGRPVDNESRLRITLAQGVARGDKMDLVLQKATELGVAAIAPVLTERTEVKLDAERSEKRLQHWRGVIAAACEQSGRARLPALSAPVPLREWAAGAAAGWYLNPRGEDSLQDLPRDIDRIVLAIGPEGGLAERDVATLSAAGFRGLRLGPRILRTETAGLAAIAAIQALRGDLG